MARRPEDLQTHPLTADFEYGSQLDLPLYAREAGDFEPTFKHPKLNGYRALVLTLTSGLGIPKAVLMFLHRNNRADSTAVTSLDLAFSVVCATGYVRFLLHLYIAS
ncbi:hypothetical protein BD410DRAFT_840830 [Rickenella mellea]|uniref:Uncharacterized protein n=1 Tax=Rickenella mellea TaxID=50990 RepID=A0A4Y7Q2N4_9AGAM|nr:hypothetical protein BD410DRAFT_840830 [Rickenella mellea]